MYNLKLNEARQRFEEILSREERAYGPKHPHVARALHNLGLLILKQLKQGAPMALQLPRSADLDRAQQCFERALTILINIFGPEHEDLSASQFHLGELLFWVGDLAQAERLVEQAITLEIRSHGEAHPIVADRLGLLGVIKWQRHDQKGARRELERALAIITAAHGPDHPETQKIRQILSCIAPSR